MSRWSFEIILSDILENLKEILTILKFQFGEIEHEEEEEEE